MSNNGWLPIESAPRNGTWLLLTDGFFVCCGAWAPSVHGEKFPWVFVESIDNPGPCGCCDNEDDTRIPSNAWTSYAPTHWQPFPELPGDAA